MIIKHWNKVIHVSEDLPYDGSMIWLCGYVDTGFGSEEDSLNSTKKLLPEPVKKDFNKFMGYDRSVTMDTTSLSHYVVFYLQTRSW